MSLDDIHDYLYGDDKGKKKKVNRNSPDKKHILTKRNIKFLHEYMNNGNIAWKAYKAVYKNISDATAMTEGPALLKEPHISTELDKLQQKVIEKYEIDRDYLVSELTELIKSCKEDGIPIGGGKIIKDRANWNKAVAQLSKMFGFDVNKLDITSDGERISINFNLGTDDKSKES